MYTRLLKYPHNKSFFLFGPRGTGKTTWLKKNFPEALYLDLLDSEIYTELLAHPARLRKMIPPHFKDWIILDEVQKVPELLNEVHRLIENEHHHFILTGSSARKLRKQGVNLLAGRALTYRLYPLTSVELGPDFKLNHALQFGHLPSTFSEKDPAAYLESYLHTYLKEEVQQEALTRNLAAFARFLEVATYSQASILNTSALAREAAIDRKVAENYFSILEDLMIAYRIPVFAKKAKRRLITHEKFYFFDVGVYQTLKPKGPLDVPSETEGRALESLFLQELIALNAYLNLKYQHYFWHTPSHLEVDFVLYGPRGLIAIEVKRGANINPKDLHSLKAFLKIYPEAKAFMFYGGTQKRYEGKITLIPIEEALKHLKEYL